MKLDRVIEYSDEYLKILLLYKNDLNDRLNLKTIDSYS